MRRTVFAVLLCTLMSIAAVAQSTDAIDQLPEPVGRTIRIATLGGGNFQGRLVSIADDRVEIVTADGQIVQIARAAIEHVDVLAADADRRALYQDAASNRLIVMPTGFPMERGEFHVTDQEIVIVTASYGAGDHVSFWGGVSIPGLVLSARFNATPTPKLGLSAGTFLGAEWFELTTLALPYALASFGSPDRNVSVGAAGAFTLYPADSAGFTAAVLAVGGRTILTPTAALIGEMWTIWPKREEGRPALVPWLLTPAAVFRIAGNRLSWDIGAVVPLMFIYSPYTDTFDFGGIGGDTIIPIPIVSVTYRID